MAITAAQRSTALTQILVAAIAQAGAGQVLPLSQLLPGVTPGQVLSTILTALGTSVDATFTTALSNMVTSASVQITAANAADAATDAALQANITAWTVA